MTVVVLGASNKPERYSYRAITMLMAAGHRVLPVHPILKTILDLPVYARLADISEPVDTLTLYIGPDSSTKLINEILALAPKRIIFNPGAENPALFKAAQERGITVLNACTLVLLTTQQF